jgi:periplasmic protein TonB
MLERPGGIRSVPGSDRGHSAGAVGVSIVLHALAFLFVSAMIARSPSQSAEIQSAVSVKLVWAPGTGMRGGGGEKDNPKPAQRVQLVGRDSLVMPAARAARADTTKAPEEIAPRPQSTLPTVEVASGLHEAVGVLSELAPIGTGSRGPGSGPGTGKGPGSGTGDRGGPGDDGGDGLEPGDGVTFPRMLQQVKPNYTSEALRAQVQGKVELEIVVLADGTVGRVHITRSLDPTFGLDQEAIKAVKQWRFDPGRKLGKAVPVRVGVELTFTLR